MPIYTTLAWVPERSVILHVVYIILYPLFAAGLARVYVWNTECLYFSLDEALGFVRPSSTIFNSFIGL